MSSSPPPEGERTDYTTPARPGRRPLTLRAKLVISIVCLITAVCVVVGVATEVFLSRYLVGKVDSQVMQVNQGMNNSAGRRDGDDLAIDDRRAQVVQTQTAGGAVGAGRSVRDGTRQHKGEVIAIPVPRAVVHALVDLHHLAVDLADQGPAEEDLGRHADHNAHRGDQADDADHQFGAQGEWSPSGACWGVVGLLALRWRA